MNLKKTWGRRGEKREKSKNFTPSATIFEAALITTDDSCRYHHELKLNPSPSVYGCHLVLCRCAYSSFRHAVRVERTSSLVIKERKHFQSSWSLACIWCSIFWCSHVTDGTKCAKLCKKVLTTNWRWQSSMVQSVCRVLQHSTFCTVWQLLCYLSCECIRV